jgi:hypothetical protein
MYFKTQSDWEDKNPFLPAFDEPDHPCFRWLAVEMMVPVYYYHVHLVPNSIGLGYACTDILFGNIEDALAFLREYPNSTLSIQVPARDNNDEPGLYRVVAIHMSADPTAKTHIAECADGRMYAIDLLAMDIKNLNLSTVEKLTLWTQKAKMKKRRRTK